MSDAPKLSRERAERIAKAHECVRCGEYSYKRVMVKPAAKRLEESLGVVWSTEQVCGVCNAQFELGIDDDGTIVYVS
jgi:transcription elongation factor Elf1